MSLITRCPACETMFKVVPDQLRISEGWARCGQCGEIFDASQHLIAASAVDVPAVDGDNVGATTQRGSSAPEPSPDPVATHAPAVASAAAPAVHRAPADPEPPAPGALHVADPTDSPGPTDSRAAALAASSAPDRVAHVALEPEPLPAPGPALVVPAPVHAPFADSGAGFPPTNALGETADVSFMRNADKPSVWGKPAVRVFLLLLLLLLVAVLAVQFALHERDRIVSMAPSTRPLLTALCALSGCELGPVRRIESIVIDSSSFSRVRGENYRLAFSLKNNAPLDLAMPAIELALTDGQDQPVLRRVIMPAEFGAASRALAAGSDWSSSLSLSVKSNPAAERIAGYRLLAFYP